MNEIILPFDDALAYVLRHAALSQPGAAESSRPLEEALGRVMASALHADRDQPPFHRSTRDGYAVRSADAVSGASLAVTGSLRAGECWTGGELLSGHAIEIMTGAPAPEGADAVIMLEHVTSDTDTISLAAGRSISAGNNIVAQGAEARMGDLLLEGGTRLGPSEIALAASCGQTELHVVAQPQVAIIATGDELVEVGEMPATWQIRNSNTHGLAALVREAGGQPHMLPIARDTLEDIRARIAAARASDLILLSGGVSKGKYDLVEQVLTELGAEFFFTGALIQPGKPIVFGRLPNRKSQRVSEYAIQPAREWTYFFGLPGNPVSTQVTFLLFVAPLLRALGGERNAAPRFVQATLSAAVRAGANVTRFLPARMTSTSKAVSVRIVRWQGSGDLAANARANGYLVMQPMAEAAVGDTVQVLLS